MWALRRTNTAGLDTAGLDTNGSTTALIEHGLRRVETPTDEVEPPL